MNAHTLTLSGPGKNAFTSPADLTDFFINFSPEEYEALSWELYKAWIHSAEYADTDDIRRMLEFYEQQRGLMRLLRELTGRATGLMPGVLCKLVSHDNH